jgi:hypothetical protein
MGSYTQSGTIANEHYEHLAEVVRLLVVNAATGSMLAGAAIAGLAALNTTDVKCALSSAICLVAYFHYSKISAVRSVAVARLEEQLHHNSSTALEDHKGTVPRGHHTTDEALADAYRYSDWLVTLPLLAWEVQAMADRERLFLSAPAAAGLLAGCVAFGVGVRFGFEQGWIKLMLYLASFACLLIVLVDLWSHNPSHILVAFTAPWIAYGVVTGLAMILAPVSANPHTHWLVSVFKDVSFAALDVWSKACLAVYSASLVLDMHVPLLTENGV